MFRLQAIAIAGGTTRERVARRRRLTTEAAQKFAWKFFAAYGEL
jgi:hypothetical protein